MEPVKVGRISFRDYCQLTRRETEIMQLVAQGLSNQQIADQFVTSERTVRSQVSTLLQKLGFENRTQIALYCWQTGIIQPEQKLSPVAQTVFNLIAANPAVWQELRDAGLVELDHAKLQRTVAAHYIHRNGEARPPTEEGYYWFEAEHLANRHILRVYHMIGGLRVMLHGDYQYVTRLHGRWWGPLPIPWEQEETATAQG